VASKGKGGLIARFRDRQELGIHNVSTVPGGKDEKERRKKKKKKEEKKLLPKSAHHFSTLHLPAASSSQPLLGYEIPT